jgi:hypothetical protein
LERFQASGLSVARFCQGEGVSQASFYQWKRKLAGRGQTRQPGSKTNGPGRGANRKRPIKDADCGLFQAVHLVQAAGLRPGVTVRLPGGIEVVSDHGPVIEMLVERLLRRVTAGAGGPTC